MNTIFPIVMTCDASYIPWASVTLHSIAVQARTPGVLYKVYFLHTDFEQAHMEHLARISAFNTQVEIEFIHLNNFSNWNFYNGDNLDYVTISTYYRLVIPLIFKQYDHIVYFDSDVVLGIDPYELAGIELGNHVIAGVKDSYIESVIKTNSLYPFDKAKQGLEIDKYEYFSKDYYRDILKLTEVGEYINAGVLIFNLKRFRDLDEEFALLKASIVIKKPLFRDQDLINYVAKKFGGALLINRRYNLCCNDVSFIHHSQCLGEEQIWRYYQVEGGMIQTFGLDMDAYLRRMSGIDCIHHYVSAHKPWSAHAHHKLHNQVWWGCVSTMEDYSDYLLSATFPISETDLKVFEYIGKRFFNYYKSQDDTGFYTPDLKRKNFAYDANSVDVDELAEESLGNSISAEKLRSFDDDFEEV